MDANLKPAAMAAFLEVFRITGNVRSSVNAVGIHRATPYRWAKEDPTFKADWKEAEQEAIDMLVEEARRRALEGVEDYVVSMGKLVMDPSDPTKPLTKKIYSDKLLELLLRSHRPEVYGNRAAVEVGGRDGDPIRVTHQVEASFVANVLAILGDQSDADPEEGRVKLLDSASADS